MRQSKRYSACTVAGFAALLGLLAAAAPARAHPHIWIKNSPTLDMQMGHIVAITQDWTFDAFFSAALIKDFDRDKNGRFDAAEIALMKKNAFSALKDFGYFTHVRVDGKKASPTDIRAFTAKIAGGKVTYRFTLGLPKPVDPRRQKAAFLFYDHTYYVDVALSGSTPVGLKNGVGCRVSVADDKANPIYFGLVVPKMAVVSCAGG